MVACHCIPARFISLHRVRRFIVEKIRHRSACFFHLLKLSFLIIRAVYDVLQFVLSNSKTSLSVVQNKHILKLEAARQGAICWELFVRCIHSVDNRE